jgi:rRNA-processing protein FCF1
LPDPNEKESHLLNVDDLSGNHVILDANALIAPFQQSFNLDLELEAAAPGLKPVIPSSVIRELEALLKKSDWRIKAAMDLARKYPVIDVKGKGDAPIFNLAVKKQWMVMTQDRRLRNSLLKKGIPVIILRGKGHFQVIEP